MHQRLRKIAEEVAGLRIDFFRVEADVVGARQEVRHESLGLAAPARPGQRPNQPERTVEETSLAARQPIVAQVPEDERPMAEIAADRVDRAIHAAARGIAELHQRQHQQARVELLGAGGARVAAAPLGPASRLDELLNSRRLALPAIQMPRRQIVFGRKANRAIERDPAHHFRVREVLRLAADLPDA